MILYAVYGQFQPENKYDAELLSLWTTRKAAESQARKEQKIYDVVTIIELHADTDMLHGGDDGG